MQLAFDLDLPVEPAPPRKRARAQAPPVRHRRAEQLDLPGLPSAPTAPLFLAVCPDAQASAEIDQRLMSTINGLFDPRIKPVPAERWHVSLVGFGRVRGVSSDQIVLLDTMLRRLKTPAFPARFDRLMSFAPSGAIVLTGQDCAASLHDFQSSVCEALRLPTHARNFTPHMTIAYGPRLIIPQCAIRPLAWRVRELRLIHSLRNPLRHVVVARWPLAG